MASLTKSDRHILSVTTYNMLLLVLLFVWGCSATYKIGVGKSDITGPVVEVNFMGYAYLSQVGTGLRQRLFARAFIVGDVDDANNCFVYVNLDTACGDTAVRYGILDALAALGSEYAVYGQQNVAVVGTHQHSGPGAWMNYLLPQVTSLGFDQQSYEAIVTGAVAAIRQAHESLTEGSLAVATTNVTDANINRSLYAYLNNPAAERARYTSSTDETMTMLRFRRASDGLDVGVLVWFAVHGTSAYENNTHVTADNKGVAEYLFEKAMADAASAADGFVAAFTQSSVGDSSPNVLGAWCDDGSPCSFENSTCDGVAGSCHGRGPAFRALDLGITSCYEIGRRQFAPALQLYETFDSVATALTDPSVRAFHFFHQMDGFTFALPNGTEVATCAAALGYSFAAGTTDGPGPFDFTQADSGVADANPLWAVVSDLLETPTAAQVACQAPKPILLDVGQMTEPYAWAPNIVDVQLLRVGQLIVIVSPSEVTTMSGRRWKDAIRTAAVEQGVVAADVDPIVVVSSPANTYAHYVATPEEYAIQRYEGASTLYGPWQLPAYINLTVSNIGYLVAGAGSPAEGTYPPDNRNVSLDFIAGVVYDSPPLGYAFGDVLVQPASSYAAGEVVNATFVGANPRNNLRLGETFAAVEQAVADVWTVVMDDWDWYLEYTWAQTDVLLGSSQVVVSWETQDPAPGVYRMHYYGDWKDVLGTVTSFESVSTNFTISGT
ncbi:hypothetical protein ASPZODRAFT_154877 [Penicilliopsis zonata CBS 506.65]|uniref:Neutral ceramidase n=1 Tax=Penicilliopsis zonata CBS 506.65 TaxID=1073090 RepID=A0A1L9S7P6_9EURO|nr:hypothetical protein ASPZODRAFT_154877 [Penicilliopsis zonata CBS 506.65]OJJ43179.1 hypothetical protein ASPZODRAFT_154877 [Penicilliopsis zonata CBS 506.65]